MQKKERGRKVWMLAMMANILVSACSGGQEMAKGDDKSLSILGGLLETMGLKNGSGLTDSPHDLFGNDSKLVALAKAINAGDIQQLRREVTAGANVNGRGRDGITPLMYATSRRQTDAMHILVSLGANPLARASGLIGSPLATAASSKYPELLRALLDAGCDPSTVTGEGHPLIFDAILPGRLENVKLLIERGADINAVNSVGDTPLTESFLTSQYDILEYLIIKGANPKIGSDNVATALAEKKWRLGSEADLKAKQLLGLLADRGITRETPVSWDEPEWSKWRDAMREKHGDKWSFPGWVKGRPAAE